MTDSNDMKAAQGAAPRLAREAMQRIAGKLRATGLVPAKSVVTARIAEIIQDEIGGEVCNERRASFVAERIACFLKDGFETRMNDYERIADQLHEFVAAAPHNYPGHNVELFEAAETAIRSLLVYRDIAPHPATPAEGSKPCP